MSTVDRDRILRWPDLARKLTEPPLDYERPSQWNGFIPPLNSCTGQLNNSSRRDALLRLATEAYQREQNAGTPPLDLEQEPHADTR